MLCRGNDCRAPANIIIFSLCSILSDAVRNFALDAIDGSYSGPYRLNGRSILLRNYPTQTGSTTANTLTTPVCSGIGCSSEQIVSISYFLRDRNADESKNMYHLKELPC